MCFTPKQGYWYLRKTLIPTNPKCGVWVRVLCLRIQTMIPSYTSRSNIQIFCVCWISDTGLWKPMIAIFWTSPQFGSTLFLLFFSTPYNQSSPNPHQYILNYYLSGQSAISSLCHFVTWSLGHLFGWPTNHWDSGHLFVYSLGLSDIWSIWYLVISSLVLTHSNKLIQLELVMGNPILAIVNACHHRMMKAENCVHQEVCLSKNKGTMSQPIAAQGTKHPSNDNC